ncbi:hypothetical protein ISCGN_010249 [Ixodes scapularis]
MSVPTASSSSCRQRPPKFEKLEEAVNIWFAEMRSRGAAVSDEMLQEKAKEFGTTMGILVNSSAVEVEDPMDELPLAALREALRQLGEKNPDEEASAFLDIDEETNSWEPMSDEQIMELVGESAQQGHQLVENFAPTETDDEEERPTVTRCEARRGLETAIAYLEQEGDGERALQVAEVLRFLDTKVGSKASISQNEDFRRLYRMLKGYSLLSNNRLWSEETLREVADGQAVIMATRTSVLYRMAIHCRDFPNTEMYVVKERLMWFPMVVYYSRSTASDVGSAFSDRLKWVKEAGLMNKWHEDTVSRGGDPSQCPKGTTGELDTLQFNHISSVFVLLAVGLGLAVVAFVCEVAAGPLASLVGPCFTPLKRRSTRIRRFTAA